MQAMIEIALRVTGTYWRGRANAGKVQVRRSIVRLENLPSAFDGFTILHLSDLHADLSGPQCSGPLNSRMASIMISAC